MSLEAKLNATTSKLETLSHLPAWISVFKTIFKELIPSKILK